jgi:hypothetical protein
MFKRIAGAALFGAIGAGFWFAFFWLYQAGY